MLTRKLSRPLALPGPEQNTDLQLGGPGFSTPYAFNPSPKKPRSSPAKRRHNFDLMLIKDMMEQSKERDEGFRDDLNGEAFPSLPRANSSSKSARAKRVVGCWLGAKLWRQFWLLLITP
ncbi:hypothetical protein Tco_0935646 [Tanacetum coccineum]